MSKKKPKKLTTLSPAVKPTVEKVSWTRFFRPRVLSTVSFGLSGLLAGLATGLNHFPGLAEYAEIPKMMLLAAYLGDPHFDIPLGLSTGFCGLIIGTCLGFSALSNPKVLGLSALISVFMSIAVFTATGNLVLVGLSFLVGHAPVVLDYLKSR